MPKAESNRFSIFSGRFCHCFFHVLLLWLLVLLLPLEHSRIVPENCQFFFPVFSLLIFFFLASRIVLVNCQQQLFPKPFSCFFHFFSFFNRFCYLSSFTSRIAPANGHKELFSNMFSFFFSSLCVLANSAGKTGKRSQNDRKLKKRNQ